MRITKLGHCCLVLEVEGVKLLTDPGNFTTAQNDITGLDAILITHEHADHFHVESLKAVLANNPIAIVIANRSVAKLVEEAIADTVVTVVGDGQSTDVKGVKIEGFGTKHAEIYGQYGLVENTGYFVADRFYFPGDNFYNPNKPVDILALPVAGPWMKISEAIDFAKAIQPRTAFGVHDGMLKPQFNFGARMAGKLIGAGTEYVSLADGESREFLR